MDVSTLIVIAAFATSIIVVVSLKLLRVIKKRSQDILFGFFTMLWGVMTLGGEFLYSWAGNSTCSQYLGCVDGFGGYDAFEHFFFGVAMALAIIWVFERFPKYSVLHEKRWKTALTIIAMVALFSVLWEIGECAHDYFRLDVLHDHILNFRLHINNLDQPSNLDTMGDLTFSLVGSIVGFFVSSYKKAVS